MTQEPKTLKAADLMQFTGTEFWHRHPLVRTVLFTDGAKYVADTGGAYTGFSMKSPSQSPGRRFPALETRGPG